MSKPQLPISVSAAIAVVTFGITVWFLSGMITGCLDALAFRNAVLVDARLLNVDTKMIGSGDGRREQMTVKYTYEFDGLIFENETSQLSVFDRDAPLYNPMNEAYQDGRKVKCYVDPDQPSRSFFSLRFSLFLFLLTALFPIFFGGVAVITMMDVYRRKWKRSRS